LSEEGGVCTVSSSVRRARSSRGTLAGVELAAFATDVAFRAGLRGTEAFRAAGLLAAFFSAAGFRRVWRFLLGRLAERRTGARFAARRAGLTRFAAFFAF
jgi:hypothetical protein